MIKVGASMTLLSVLHTYHIPFCVKVHDENETKGTFARTIFSTDASRVPIMKVCAPRTWL